MISVLMISLCLVPDQLHLHLGLASVLAPRGDARLQPALPLQEGHYHEPGELLFKFCYI